MKYTSQYTGAPYCAFVNDIRIKFHVPISRFRLYFGERSPKTSTMRMLFKTGSAEPREILLTLSQQCAHFAATVEFFYVHEKQMFMFL